MLGVLFIALLISVLVLSVKRGVLYIPVYWLKTKQAGTKMPAVLYSFPFGFKRTKEFSKALLAGKLLSNLLQHGKTLPRTRYMQFLFRWQLISNDPENVKAFLSTKFKDFDLGFRETSLGYAFGKGIFTIAGLEWKHSRNLLRPQFARDQISQLGTVDSHVQVLFKAIDSMLQSKKYIDIQHLFHQFTIDTATEFLFGESLNSLDPLVGGTERYIKGENGTTVSAAEFVESYQQMVLSSAQRLLLGEFGWLHNSKEFRQHIDRARVVVDYYVDKAIEVKDEKPTDKYIFSHALARENLTPTEIRDQIFNILIAGRDTTAVTLSFVTYLMCTHPDVWRELRKEILSEFGTADEERPVTFEGLRSAKLLNAVINETLRLYPVVPTNQRTAVKDVVLPRGAGPQGKDPLLVTKGTSVAYHYFVIHRDTSIWGDDAEEFKPRRWLEKSQVPSWAYLPFNGGPRICLGQQFALTEIAFVYVRLAQRYTRLELSPDFNLELDVVLTLKSRNPLLVRFE